MRQFRDPRGQEAPVIVFTCGRSGSTLLARILNCLPRTVVWGEHGGALKPLLGSYTHMRRVADSRFVTKAAELLEPVLERQPILSRPGMSIEWLNWFDAADVDDLYRRHIIELFYPERIRMEFSRWGFKEIRYRDVEYDGLRQLFPDMKAIILYRDPAAICASQFKHFAKNDSTRVEPLLKGIETFFKFARGLMTDLKNEDEQVLFISYEDLVENFCGSVAHIQEFVQEEFIEGVGQIGQDIRGFRAKRSKGTPSGNPVDDFASWRKSVDAAVPMARFRHIAGHYEEVRLRAALGREPRSRATDPESEPEA